MTIEIRQKVSEALMHSSPNNTEFQVSHLSGETYVLKIRSTNWNNQEAFEFTLFTNQENLQNLETILHFFNLDQDFAKNGVDATVNAHHHEKVTA